MGCVYRLTCQRTGLSYIGQITKPDKTLDDRLDEHWSVAKGDSDRLLMEAIREFGLDAFACEVLCEDDDDNRIDELERYYIKRFNTNATNGGIGYNMTSGGQGTQGFKWSEASRDKKRKHCPVSRGALVCMGNTMTTQEIATAFRVIPQTVQRWFKRFGCVKPRVQRVFNNQNQGMWNNASEEALLEMYAQGKSNEEIALALGRTTTAVSIKHARLRKKLGLVGGMRRRRNQHMITFKWEQ